MPTRDDDSGPDWLDAPYVRVYATLAADHPILWRDKALLGWYVALLMASDALWPGLASLPRGLPEETLETLTEEGIVEVVDDLYRIRALDRERLERTSGRSLGGKARARNARRDQLGRMLADAGDAGSMLDRPAGPVAGPMLVRTDEPFEPDIVSEVDAGDAGDAGVLLDRQLEDVAGGSSIPASHAEPSHDDDNVRHSTSTLSSSSSRVRVKGRPSPSPEVIDCDDPVAHASQHRYWPGIGWKCQPCEAARAAKDRSLKEKVVEHGGSVW